MIYNIIYICIYIYIYIMNVCFFSSLPNTAYNIQCTRCLMNFAKPKHHLQIISHMPECTTRAAQGSWVLAWELCSSEHNAFNSNKTCTKIEFYYVTARSVKRFWDHKTGQRPVWPWAPNTSRVLLSNFEDLQMQYVKNNIVLMRILFVLRGCIPVELQGPARFAKLHSEIMNVVRMSVDSTCYAGIRNNKKKHGAYTSSTA